MLQKVSRVNKKKEFDQFFGVNFKKNKGINISSGNLIVKVFFNNKEKSRFGFIVANTIDKRATVRNLVKRRLREIVMKRLDRFSPPVDGLILAKPAAKKLEFIELEKDVEGLFRKIRAYDTKNV